MQQPPPTYIPLTETYATRNLTTPQNTHNIHIGPKHKYHINNTQSKKNTPNHFTGLTIQQNEIRATQMNDQPRSHDSREIAHPNNNNLTRIPIQTTRKTEEEKHTTHLQITLNPDDQNLPVGDIMQNTKKKHTFRIYYQNINGVNKLNWEEWKQASDQLKKLQVDAFGCAETNIAWTVASSRYAQSQMKLHHQQACLTTGNSLEVGTTKYQPGGTASRILGKWTGRILSTLTDTSGLGRWTGHLLIGKNNFQIAILTAYRPVLNNGYNTSYQQQWRILRNENTHDPDPRALFLADLTGAIHSWRQKQYEVIILWDANGNIDSHTSPIHQFMIRNQLAPVHLSLPQVIYSRGSTCIDFIMATPRICEATPSAGYTSFYTGI
jgi:hypothetical protein